MTILAHILAKEARRLAKERILYDPTDDDIVLAVLDLVAPNKEVPLTDDLRAMVVREYERYSV